MMCYIHNTCACDSRACVYLYLRNSTYIYIYTVFAHACVIIIQHLLLFSLF